MNTPEVRRFFSVPELEPEHVGLILEVLPEPNKVGINLICGINRGPTPAFERLAQDMGLKNGLYLQDQHGTHFIVEGARKEDILRLVREHWDRMEKRWVAEETHPEFSFAEWEMGANTRVKLTRFGLEVGIKDRLIPQSVSDILARMPQGIPIKYGPRSH